MLTAVQGSGSSDFSQLCAEDWKFLVLQQQVTNSRCHNHSFIDCEELRAVPSRLLLSLFTNWFQKKTSFSLEFSTCTKTFYEQSIIWVCWKYEQGPIKFMHLVYITMEFNLAIVVQSNLGDITSVLPFTRRNKKNFEISAKPFAFLKLFTTNISLLKLPLKKTSSSVFYFFTSFWYLILIFLYHWTASGLHY